ncbi:unnamed protein product [Victoria cruziana]
MTSTVDFFVPTKVLYSQRCTRRCRFVGSQDNLLFLRQRPGLINLYGQQKKLLFCRTSIFCSISNSYPSDGKVDSEDFTSKVLRENPSQVEPRFLVGDRIYTLKEREQLKEGSFGNVLTHLAKQLQDSFFKRKDVQKTEVGPEENVIGEEKEVATDPVYLKDILREFKGKLYVPEEMFKEPLSEKEEFDRSLTVLPKMSFEECMKALQSDKIKLLSSRRINRSPFAYGYRDFIVDLKEIPGDKRLQRTKWAMQLTEQEAQVVLDEYKGLQSEIEMNTTSYVGKSPDFPHPMASAISSRVVVELACVTSLIVGAALVIGGFLASAAIAIASSLFFTSVFVIWPLARPLFKFFLSVVFSIGERVWENISDLFSDGGIFARLYDFYTFGGIASSIEMLKPIMFVVVTMALLVRFTLSRRPKNFRKWDIWQGIEFGQSKPQARVDGSTGVMFSDVAGIDEAVEELQELVRYLKNPELFDKLAIKPPHGVLLEGPPGCGKTLVAKAIAGEAGVPFYQMAGSEFVEVLVGVGSARIRDLFKRAKVNKPSVVFIDEIDALATRREGIFSESTNNLYNAATQERETTLNQLLIELDGFDTGKGVIFLGATNRMDLLDPALLRPGRFDRKIRIRPPGAKGRLDILKVHARKVKMSPSVDLSTYAQNLPGWTGAKLAQLLQEAALVAVRNGHDSIVDSDLDDAVDRLTVGPRRLGIDLGHQGQTRRATTEIGTALTSHLLRRFENAAVECCERISINPRGQTYSQIVFHRLDDESYMFERHPQLLHRLQMLLGGRAAEEVMFGRDTSTASINYLADASWLARKIISVWNLENPMVIHGEPAPWRKSVSFIGPRLDFEGSLYDDYGLFEPPLNYELDDMIARRTVTLIHDMYAKTVSLLRRHHAALYKTVQVLLERREISGEEIEYILDTYPADTPVDRVLNEENPGSLPFSHEKVRKFAFSSVPSSEEESLKESVEATVQP